MATTINARLIHKRGTEASIPTLKDGQIYLCTDTDKIFKGTSTGENKLIGDINSLIALKEKDLRTGIFVNEEIFSNNISVLRPYLNKWVTVQGTNINNAPHSGALWAEVLTGGDYGSGTSSRVFQIATCIFFNARKVYIRYLQDTTWSDWKYFATGQLKVLELKNGWEKFDLEPTYSLTGNTLTINARIRNGVVTRDTLIAETGFYASGGQSSFYNCYTPTGQQIGSVAFTNDGRILIINEISANTDVCINFSVCVNS